MKHLKKFENLGDFQEEYERILIDHYEKKYFEGLDSYYRAELIKTSHPKKDENINVLRLYFRYIESETTDIIFKAISELKSLNVECDWAITAPGHDQNGNNVFDVALDLPLPIDLPFPELQKLISTHRFDL